MFTLRSNLKLNTGGRGGCRWIRYYAPQLNMTALLCARNKLKNPDLMIYVNQKWHDRREHNMHHDICIRLGERT